MTVTEAEDGLNPNDPVGNALLDAQNSADPRLLRVLNYHGNWAESAPTWEDFRTAIQSCHGDIAARWPAQDEHGDDVIVRATKYVGSFERVAARDGTTITNVATVTGGVIEDLCALRGAPRLVPLDNVFHHFEDGAHR